MGRFDSLLQSSPSSSKPPKPSPPPEEKREDSATSNSEETAHPQSKSNGQAEHVASAGSHDHEKASTQSSYHASTIDSIRSTVRRIGKETAFVRLTPEEKQQLADIVYTYKRQGTRTSENEVCRIAINLLIEDYRASGRESVLARVIEALYS